ncbi:MAG TPA: CRISPR-associated endonuclease Cas1 [Phycisphaerae bacterium]|nr:CRISPR-associated endonuclease Cas1 [Phycisphaerae bacterium]
MSLQDDAASRPRDAAPEPHVSARAADATGLAGASDSACSDHRPAGAPDATLAGATGSDHDGDETSLLPVRMLNEFTYCPRLFHFMHVEGRWADNVYTVEGKAVHRRVDKLDQALPDAVNQAGPNVDTSAGSDALRRDGAPNDSCDATRAGAPSLSVSDDAPVAENSRGSQDDNGVRPARTSKSRKRGTSADGKPLPDGRGSVKGLDTSNDGDEPPVISRSVPLGSHSLGITAKLDLVSTAAGPDGAAEAVPVETKRGRVPDNEHRCYEPERVQLMAQGLLLREHGYRCDHGVLYFAGSRTRVDVPFTAELEARTLAQIEQARQAAHRRDLPPPLEDSPKCNGCSLNGICLPDETLALQHVPADPLTPSSGGNGNGHAVRRLYPARQDALPLYVQEQGAIVTKTSKTLVIKKQGQELGRAGLKDVSHLVLCGNIGVTAQTVHLLCEAGIPIVHLSMGQWFYGVTQGITLRNAYDRAAQFAAAGQPHRCLAFARELVSAKGMNQRTILRRNASPPQRTLDDMSDLLTRVEKVQEIDQLLGLEGAIAAHYFKQFNNMLSPRDFDAQWDFNSRNRRPPRDPINALLSFGYALLTKECTVALLGEGLDPWWGLYHQPRHGRPALALDLMEPFRPLIVDSAVITAVNTGMVQAGDFTQSNAACMMNDRGRKAMIRAYEARLDQLITHPVFDYRCSWRAVVRLQARLLARWLRGDIPKYESIVTR